jgi:hypothetical protein
MLATPNRPVRPVSALNMPNQIPWPLQRLKRYRSSCRAHIPVDSRATALQTAHVDDPADDPSIIDTMRTAPASRQQWLDPPPFLIVQPIELLPHQGLPRFGSFESQLATRWIPY